MKDDKLTRDEAFGLSLLLVCGLTLKFRDTPASETITETNTEIFKYMAATFTDAEFNALLDRIKTTFHEIDDNNSVTDELIDQVRSTMRMVRMLLLLNEGGNPQ